MPAQTVKLAGKEYVLLPAREYRELQRRARPVGRRARSEDEYWTRAALEAEADARAKGDKPIPLETVERELDARRAARRGRR